MILYLDTSALLKLFIAEDRAELVTSQLAKATVVATSRVAYAEACAALARRRRKRLLSLDEFMACQLAMKHGLRAFDAVHRRRPRPAPKNSP